MCCPYCGLKARLLRALLEFRWVHYYSCPNCRGRSRLTMWPFCAVSLICAVVIPRYGVPLAIEYGWPVYVVSAVVGLFLLIAVPLYVGTLLPLVPPHEVSDSQGH